jgi:hypothetical protein
VPPCCMRGCASRREDSTERGWKNTLTFFWHRVQSHLHSLPSDILYIASIFFLIYIYFPHSEILSTPLPPFMASKLVNLPVDLFGPISSFLFASDICRLWFAGSRTLCHKLAKGTTHFDLDYSRARQFVFPNIVSSLSAIQHFCLEMKECESIPFIDGVDISKLPPTIRSMTMKISNNLLSLLNASSLVQAGSSTVPQDIGLLFPSLSSILILNNYFRLNQIAMDSFLDTFPRSSLTSFSMPQHSISVAKLKHLPRTLLNLQIMMENWSGLWFYNEKPLKELKEVDLPPSLTKLEIQCLPYMIAHFPKTIIWLNLATIMEKTDEMILGKLPPSLTNLHLNLPRFSLEPQHVSLFPRSITCLTIQDQSSNLDFIPVLPQRLTSLSLLSSEMKIIPNSLSLLPPSLTHISGLPLSKLPSHGWHLFPRNIQKCTERSYIDISEKDIPFIKDLPSIQIKIALYTNVDYLPPCTSHLLISVLSPSLWKLLPLIPMLAHLILDCTPLNNGDVVDLSPLNVGNGNLKSLKLWARSPWPSIDFSQLDFSKKWACNLEHLGIDENVLPEEEECKNPKIWFKSLPNSLRKLEMSRLSLGTLQSFIYHANISNFQPGMFPAEMFCLLPPMLEQLIVSVPSLRAHHFKKLPRTLKILKVEAKSANCHYQPDDFHLLPFHLRTLNLPEAESWPIDGRWQVDSVWKPFVNDRPNLEHLRVARDGKHVRMFDNLIYARTQAVFEFPIALSRTLLSKRKVLPSSSNGMDTH